MLPLSLPVSFPGGNEEGRVANEKPTTISLIREDGAVEVLREIVVPKKYYNRVKLGAQVVDEIFGGVELPGIVPGASYLFTGLPGAGKSTMALQLADMFQKSSGRNVLYNVGEENKYVIKMRADRIGVDGNYCISGMESVDQLVGYVKSRGVEVLFQDSIQSLRDGALAGHARLKSVVKKLHKLAKDDDVIVFLIGHITKGGGFAGPKEIQHDVDAHAHLKINRDTGNRIFELEKNRFGPAQVPYEFVLSASGIDFQQVKVVEEGEDGEKGTSRAADRRERIKKLIREKLLEGEKISGYCFERFEVECSGGFWRGMLARAVKELEAEGKRIAEARSGPSGIGRAHFYVEAR